MTTAELMEGMIAASGGDRHDIDHFVRVWAYARTIGALEGLDTRTQRILEAAAIVHDIACPLCREKYGDTGGKHQEQEGMPLAAAFLADRGIPEDETARIVELVGHHHTYTGILGPDHQILLEADLIANALEGGWDAGKVRRMADRLFRTPSGKALLCSIFQI